VLHAIDAGGWLGGTSLVACGDTKTPLREHARPRRGPAWRETGALD